MRRLMLLIAAGTLWLFLAAVPAFADGGPHIASQNSGVSSLTTDSCAGCHRVHTAQAPLLLKTDEEKLCLTCHGAGNTGATTDVESGLQYAVDNDDNNIIGALRSGGFVTAYIGEPAMYATPSSRGGVTKNSKIQVATTPGAVKSAHLPEIAGLAGTLEQPGIAWGNGANGTGAGPDATITCASCHNPHGNGQYRILNKIPAGTGIDAGWYVDIFDFGAAGYPANTFRSKSSMGVINGDTISILGNSAFGGATNIVTGTITMVDGPDSQTTPDDNAFTLSGVTAAGTGTDGKACRGTWAIVSGAPVCTPSGTKVTDDVANVAVTRNYTVIQTLATAPTLTASAAANNYDPDDGDYFHYKVPWDAEYTPASGGNPAVQEPNNLDAPNGIPGGSTTSTIFTGGFNEQMTAWCASCHTRYWAWSEPTGDIDGSVGPAYDTPRPGDDVFTYQHRTRGASGRACTTCHVSHGSNAEMTEPYSSNYLWPDQVEAGELDNPNAVGSNNSRLLKVDNRGTCVLCHDPTGTLKLGDQYPAGPLPGTP